ncbi:MAG: reverse gyrase, partial [Thermoprotei archaeon]
MIPAVFRGLCPGGAELRTHERSPCIEEELVEVGKEFNRYVEFFESCLGSPPWEVQRMWARRVLSRRSFAAIAPTGVGKTVFGLITSYYFAARGWGPSYLIFPTSMLVDQAVGNLRRYEGSVGEPVRILHYRSGMGSAARREFLERLSSGEFDILVTTSQYLAKNHASIRRGVDKFSFVFVDDVDSFLRNSKNVDRVLTLMGFREEDVRNALSGEESWGSTDSVLVVSTATGRPGPRVSLFRRLLGFDVGILRRELLRNVADIYTRDEESLKRFMRGMGDGFFLFVPKMELAEEARRIVESLGYRAAVMRGYDEEAVEAFRTGELDALIGAARPYGVLVRGVDLPQRVRYVVFYGVPRFEMGLRDLDDMSDRGVAAIFSVIARGLDPEARRLAARLRRGATPWDLERARSILREVLSDRERMSQLSSGDITVLPEEGKIVIPDIRTYIQGSGRSSRLYPGGMTKGASLVWDRDRLLNAFLKRASAYDLEFAPLEEVDLDTLRREVDESRRSYGSLKTGYERAGLLKTALFIVESPNKAKTIAKFFGKPSRRIMDGIVAYEVTTGDYVLTIVASGGHVVDLATEGGYHGVLIEGDGERRLYVPIYSSIKRCLDCGHQFTDGSRCPRCGSLNLRDSLGNVVSMRRLSFEASRVIIGTDPDTEGEKISWDIYQLIKDAAGEVYRAEFHEVTKRAILEALNQLGEINESRVKAQVVRRIEDRWIGFELSYEVQRRFNRKNLSAGRAQTPTLGWIIERYEEHRRRKDLTVITGDGISIRVEGRISSPGARRARLVPLSVEEEVVAPPPPFTTDEMIREASRVLKLGARRAMDIAQSLFEAGLITYHRTDSTRVGDAGLRVAAEVLGDDFVPRRWGKGGAHECIRPTKPLSARELLDYMREGILT